MVFKSLIEKICTPPVLAERDQFLIKMAESKEEVEQAQRLRYEVFNMEQGKGLSTATKNRIDRDEFDEFCFHLVVVEKETGKIVGTYRCHPGSIAANNGIGFYSSREYHIDGLERISESAIEVGRSCVHPDYRNGTVVALLWSGIAIILKRSGMNYLLGCVSLETTQPDIGWALYEYFKEKNYLCPVLKALPTREFILEHPGESVVRRWLDEDRRSLLRCIPPLFKGYLRLGVGICGTPALDEEFGTIDYLILFDFQKLPGKYFRHFCT